MVTINLASLRFRYSAAQLAKLPGYSASEDMLEIPDGEFSAALDAMGESEGGDLGAYQTGDAAIKPDDAIAYSSDMLAQHCAGCPQHLAEEAVAPQVACAGCKTCGGRRRINPAYQACPLGHFVSLWTLRRKRA